MFTNKIQATKLYFISNRLTNYSKTNLSLLKNLKNQKSLFRFRHDIFIIKRQFLKKTANIDDKERNPCSNPRGTCNSVLSKPSSYVAEHYPSQYYFCIVLFHLVCIKIKTIALYQNSATNSILKTGFNFCNNFHKLILHMK